MPSAPVGPADAPGPSRVASDIKEGDSGTALAPKRGPTLEEDIPDAAQKLPGSVTGSIVGIKRSATSTIKSKVKSMASRITVGSYSPDDEDDNNNVESRGILTMKSSQLKKSRQWNYMMMTATMEGGGKTITPPSYAIVYRLSTLQEETNGKKSYKTSACLG
mgnify:CR=1 FL=1